jgi:hypothetical protein
MFSDGQKPLSTNEAVTCTMLCFCDIPPEQLGVHMKKYSSFGIAFSKKMLLEQGATPVYYVARNARNASNRAIGVGLRTMGEQFDVLHSEIQRIRNDLEGYIGQTERAPTRSL